MIAGLREPWAITQDGLELVIAVATRDKHFSEVRERALEARAGAPLDNTRTATQRNGVAIIPVTGPLFRHASMMTEVSGATSYADVRKDFQAALENPAIHSILFAIDSPGGEVNGLAELAQAVYEARGRKRIESYVGGTGASAAYWLASSTSRITTTAQAQLGSIGVIASYIDDRKALEMEGLQEITFVSSQSPHKRPDLVESKDDRARFQERINTLGEMFVETMARNRGVSKEHVMSRFGQGATLLGADSVKAQLADGLGSFEAVLADLVNHHTQGALMNTMRASLDLPEEATDDQVIAAAVEGMQAKKDLAALVTALGAKDADEARGKAAAVSQAIADLAAVRAEQAKAAAEAVQSGFRAALEQALDAGRLTLGQLTTVIPTMLDEEAGAAAAKAMDEAEKQDAASLVKAACSVQVSPRALTRVKAFLAAQSPVAPMAVNAPPHESIGAVLTDEDLKYCERHGIDPKAMTASKTKRAAK